MPRKPRYFIPGVATHIVQIGKNHNSVFFDENDYRVYLESLKKSSRSYGCDIHAYVLMPNHVHILATPNEADSVSRMIQYIGRYYVPYANGKYGNKGGLWAGRYKASLVHEDAYLLDCMRFIELNPVRRFLAKTPAEYQWSSYHANALEYNDPILTPHPLYSDLGETVAARRKKYRDIMSETPMRAELLELIHSAWKSGTPLGEYGFLQQVEKQLDTKVGHYKQGRPKKELAYH